MEPIQQHNGVRNMLVIPGEFLFESSPLNDLKTMAEFVKKMYSDVNNLYLETNGQP
jgi:hypothetical protein